MFTHQIVLDKYHAYFWTCIESNAEPLCYEDWYSEYFTAYVTGLTSLMAKN